MDGLPSLVKMFHFWCFVYCALLSVFLYSQLTESNKLYSKQEWIVMVIEMVSAVTITLVWVCFFIVVVDDLKCPITQEPFKDPVVASGKPFSRSLFSHFALYTLDLSFTEQGMRQTSCVCRDFHKNRRTALRVKNSALKYNSILLSLWDCIVLSLSQMGSPMSGQPSWVGWVREKWCSPKG